MRDLSVEEQKKLLKIKPEAIGVIPNLDDKVAIKFLTKQPHYIKYIKNPSNAIVEFICTQRPYMLSLLTDFIVPKDLLGNIFIHHPYYINNIKNVDEETIIIWLENAGWVHEFPEIVKDFITEEIAIKYLNKHPHLFKYIENKTDDICIKAIIGDSDNMKYIKDPSEELQMKLMNINSSVIRYIKDPSEEIQMKMINSLHLLNFIKHPCKKLQQFVFEYKPEFASVLQEVDDEFKDILVEKYPYDYYHIANDEVKEKIDSSIYKIID